MERWKEILKIDLNSVAKGWREVGKDVGRLEAVIERIEASTKQELARLLNEAHVEYFAGKLDTGGYEKTAALEEQQKANQEASE